MALSGNRTRHCGFRGVRLPVLDVGAGPVLGYLHGPLGNPGTPLVVERLARAHRVIAPTLPGFFGAEAVESLRTLHDWIAALGEIVEDCGLSGKPVVASSITAMLALELAAIHPGAFEQLFLIAPLGLWDEADPVGDLYACLSGEERKLLVSDPKALAGIFEDEGVSEPEALVQRSVDRFVARTTSASIIWPIPEFGLSGRIHRVKCPVTLIWGADDTYVPPSYAGRFRQLLPNLRAVHIVDGASHLVDLDRPDDVAALIQKVLGRELASS